jgi:serine/threonine-protein kinase
VHRDIKSNNIKINSAGEVKLLDFGIAKGGSSPSLTMTGDVIGTLHYLSPEQIRGGIADSRSDIWALGVLLYEMVTGRLPFEATTLGDLCDKISKATYTTPSALNLSLPREVEGILSRCLKKKPEDRYQSAADLLRDIRNARHTTQQQSTAPTVIARSGVRTTPVHVPVQAPLAYGATVAPAPKSRAMLWAIVASVAALLVVAVYLMIPGSETATPTPGPAPPTAPQANKNTAPVVQRPPMKSLRIESMEGPADVYIDGKLVGVTPYSLEAPVGERVHLVLKREGFLDRQEEIEVSERNVYTYSLKQK